MKRRTRYDMRHNVSTVGNIGELVPFLSIPVSPGDTWQGRIGLIIRFAPMWHSLLHNLHIDCFLFYTPYRLLWDQWEDFLAAGPGGSIEIPDTTVSDPALFMPQWGHVAGVNDRRWLPPGVDGSHVGTDGQQWGRVYSMFPRAALNLIYNEYFRDQQIQPAVTSSDIEQVNNTGNWRVNNKREYWTELRQFETIGPMATAAVAGTAPDQYVSADSILAAIALQKQMMKRATYGTRYIDILKSFGVNITVAMLQRPECIAASHGLINITDVVGTSGQDAPSGLGQLAGYGVHGARLSLRRKSFNEHGHVLGLLVVRPPFQDAALMDVTDTFLGGQSEPNSFGLAAQSQYKYFYDPALEVMPPIDIKPRDVFAYAVKHDQDFLGYMPWYEWFRKTPNRVHVGVSTVNGPTGSAGEDTQFRRQGWAMTAFGPYAGPPAPGAPAAPPNGIPDPQFWVSGSNPNGPTLYDMVISNAANVFRNAFVTSNFIFPYAPIGQTNLDYEYQMYIGAANQLRAIRMLGPGNPIAHQGAT